MKKLILIFSVFFIFIGCSSFEIVEKNSVSNERSNYIEYEFEYLDGYKKKDMWIDKGEEVEVEFTIEIEDGTVEFTIEDEKGNVLYEIDSSQTITVTNDSKKLFLRFEADKAEGYFEVDWNN